MPPFLWIGTAPIVDSRHHHAEEGFLRSSSFGGWTFCRVMPPARPVLLVAVFLLIAVTLHLHHFAVQQQQQQSTSEEEVDTWGPRVTTTDSPIAVVPRPSARRHRVDGPSNRTIAVIHVGKTGGSTLDHSLPVLCRFKGNPKAKQTCLDQARPYQETPLAVSVRSKIHCGSERGRLQLHQVSSHLWTIRHPLKRLVSWYNYRHPANCPSATVDPTSPACASHKATKSHWLYTFFRTCFPTLESWGQTLLWTMENKNNCTEIGKEAILGLGPLPSSHLKFNYHHYAERTNLTPASMAAPKNWDKEILVLRTEHFEQDFWQIHEFLRNNPYPLVRSARLENEPSSKGPNQLSGVTQTVNQTSRILLPKVTHGSESYVHKSRPSPTAQRALCCWLKPEIAIYRWLVIQSVNLSPADKHSTLSVELDENCGGKGWESTCPSEAPSS